MPNYDYPLTKFYFQVEWKGVDQQDVFGGFQEVTGLEMTREKAEYRHGLDKKFVKRQIPGMKSYGELTLKRGTFSGDNDLFKWWNGEVNPAQDGTPDRRTITITMKNNAGVGVFTWIVEEAWPTKLTATDLMAENNEIAVETLVLCHEGIRQDSKVI